MAANVNENAANNNPLGAIQGNLFDLKENAWKVLPGAKPRRLPDAMVKRFQEH
jgi:hypothetical protein